MCSTDSDRTAFGVGCSALTLTKDDDNVDTLGGYRLVRKLGTGTHSDVWLGSDGAHTAAIKVFRAGAVRDHIDAEIESLGRASGRHVVQLEDLAMEPNGTPCLILQRLSPWSLARILEGGKPSAGESVTILAPLSLAVAELHRVGVAHGRIRASSVLFDSAGAPVLASFGGAELFGDMPMLSTDVSVSPLMLHEHSGVASDIRDLAALCTATLDPESETSGWLADARDRDPTSFAVELAERLFRSAKATPVYFADTGRTGGTALIPVRVSASKVSVSEVSASEVSLQSNHRARSVRGSDATRLLHLPEGMATGVNDWLTQFGERIKLTTVLRNVKESLKPVRKPVWITAGVVAVAVVGAVAFLPAIDHPGRQDSLPPTTTPTPNHSFGQESSHSVATLRSDDPVAAASVLLAARIECFDARSVLCLDGVNQQGSAAMDADAVHVRLLQSGGADDGSTMATSANGEELGEGEPTISIVERLGDTALLSVTYGTEGAREPSFSLLLIKDGEEWRVRDYVSVGTSTEN